MVSLDQCSLHYCICKIISIAANYLKHCKDHGRESKRVAVLLYSGVQPKLVVLIISSTANIFEQMHIDRYTCKLSRKKTCGETLVVGF